MISESWVDESTAAYSEVGYFDYGYMWWTTDEGAYLAVGTGGQRVYVNPKLRLVLVNRVDTSSGIGRAVWFSTLPRYSAVLQVQIRCVELRVQPTCGGWYSMR